MIIIIWLLLLIHIIIIIIVRAIQSGKLNAPKFSKGREHIKYHPHNSNKSKLPKNFKSGPYFVVRLTTRVLYFGTGRPHFIFGLADLKIVKPASDW